MDADYYPPSPHTTPPSLPITPTSVYRVITTFVNNRVEWGCVLHQTAGDFRPLMYVLLQVRAQRKHPSTFNYFMEFRSTNNHHKYYSWQQLTDYYNNPEHKNITRNIPSVANKKAQQKPDYVLPVKAIKRQMIKKLGSMFKNIQWMFAASLVSSPTSKNTQIVCYFIFHGFLYVPARVDLESDFKLPSFHFVSGIKGSSRGWYEKEFLSYSNPV